MDSTAGTYTSIDDVTAAHTAAILNDLDSTACQAEKQIRIATVITPIRTHTLLQAPVSMWRSKHGCAEVIHQAGRMACRQDLVL